MENLEKLREVAYKATSALAAAETKLRAKKNAELVGKCFRYHNSGGGCTGRWWLYAKVLETKDGGLICFKFQKLPNGNMMIEPLEYVSASHLTNSYSPIPAGDFNKAWRAVQKHVASL